MPFSRIVRDGIFVGLAILWSMSSFEAGPTVPTVRSSDTESGNNVSPELLSKICLVKLVAH